MPLSRINSASIANSAVIAADIADGTITAAKIISIANTQITGNIISSQITSVANTQLTGTITGSQISSNTLSNTVFQTGSVENYMSAAGLGFGMRNRIINGAMVIDQRNAGASVAITSADQYVVDRFNGGVFGSGTGRFSLQQSSTVPAGFTNSLLATVTTADASPSASYAYSIIQYIEGYNIADLGWGTANAQSATLSFWVRSSVTGTFPVIFQNSAADKAYGGQYTISSANTWEQKSIVVSGVTSGTWLTTNGIGIRTIFGLGGGSSRTISAGLQTVGGAITQTNVTGSTQLIATNGATFYITGVQLEKGSTATSFDFRSITQETALCQRYYYDTVNSSGSGFSTTGFVAAAVFPVTMRTSPTATMFYSGTQNRIYTIINAAQVTMTPTILSSTTAILGVYDTGISTLGVGTGYLMNFKCSAEL